MEQLMGQLMLVVGSQAAFALRRHRPIFCYARIRYSSR